MFESIESDGEFWSLSIDKHFIYYGIFTDYFYNQFTDINSKVVDIEIVHY